MAELLTADNLIALLTLTLLEVVLGIDNVVFIAILAGKLPPEQQKRARTMGLLLAMITRVLLLLSIKWLMGLTDTLFTVVSHPVTGKDLILLGGGLFLIFKATHEIHGKLEGGGHAPGATKAVASFAGVVVQILLIDIVFSLDSVITAVGMADEIVVMIIAVILAVIVMMASAGPIASFVERHPTVKMLALSFLVLIGTMLVAEGSGHHIPKGYIYVAMAFSLIVEMLNLKAKKAAVPPVVLHEPKMEEGQG